MAAQIPVGDDAGKPAVGLGDGDAAESLADISTIASDISAPRAISGTDLPGCKTSRMNLRPRRACRADERCRNRWAVKPRLSSRAIASASPSASCISVDVVGARLCGHASRAGGSVNAMSAALPSALSMFPGDGDQRYAEAARIVDQVF